MVGSRVESSLDEWNKVRVALPSVDNSLSAGRYREKEGEMKDPAEYAKGGAKPSPG